MVCAKYTCRGIAGGTGVLAGAVTFDQVLESSGREKIFLPFICRLFNDIFGEPMGDQHISNLKTSANPVAPDGQYVQLPKEYSSLSPEEKLELQKVIQEHIRKLKKSS